MIDNKKTETSKLYQKGIDFLRKNNFFENREKCLDFYNGDQWKNIEDTKIIKPVIYNILKPIVKYKMGYISTNEYDIVFSPANYTNLEKYEKQKKITEILNQYMSILFEKQKIDITCRRILKSAAVTGQGIAYINYDDEKEEVKVKEITSNCILFSDEANENIQDQEYIIMSERTTLENAKDIASKYTEDKEKVNSISADDENIDIYTETEKNDVNAKTTIYYKFYKSKTENKETKVLMCVSTNSVDIATDIDTGLNRYPFAIFNWENVEENARGQSEILNIIPNQIEINKTVTRRLVSVMQGAYPKLVYNKGVVKNIKDITKIGAVIELDDKTFSDVRNSVNFLPATQISSDSISVLNELVTNTRDLNGASESAAGSVNPEKSSGRAILAVQQASQIPLTEQLVLYKNFLEDVALCILDNWKNKTKGIKNILIDDGKEANMYEIGADAFNNISDFVKIDVTPATPFDRYTREQFMETLLLQGIINFNEYVENLPASSNMAKVVLEGVLKTRERVNNEIAEAEKEAIMIKMAMQEQIANQEQVQMKADETMRAIEDEDIAKYNYELMNNQSK